MKFSLVAIVAAFLCVAAVSAAPSPSFEPLFGDLTYTPLEGITDKIKAFVATIKCAVNVAENELKNSELKSDFEEFKKTMDQLFSEIKECPSSEEKFKCAVNIIKKINSEVQVFFSKVTAVNKELAEKIRKQIESQCVKSESFDLELEDDLLSEDLTYAPFEGIAEKIKAFIAKIKCALKVVENELKNSELKSDFEEFKKTIDQLFNEVKKCPSSEEKIKCTVDIIKKIKSEVEAFVSKVTAVNKELAEKIRKEVESQCGKPESFDLEIEDIEDVEQIQLFLESEEEGNVKLPKFLQKLKCQTRGIRDACIGTKWQPIFDAHRDAMWKVEDEIKDCQQKESNKLKQAKCMVEPLKKAAASFVPFFQGLAELYKETKTQDKELGAKIAAELEKCNV